jgi:hypothetical protein
MVEAAADEPTGRGAIRSRATGDRSNGWFAYAPLNTPIVAGRRRHHVPAGDGVSAPLRVWRDRSRLRIEEPDGSVNLIVGDTKSWQFSDDAELPLEAPKTGVLYAGNATPLVTRRAAAEFLENDFTRPAGPVSATTFLGRTAWSVELAPPPHKPHPIQLVVDAETGLVLQQRNDGFGTVDEWIEFVVGEPIDDELFAWTGAVRTLADRERDHEDRHEADLAARRAWFTSNVADLPLRVELEVDVLVHTHDDTGGFEASIDGGNVGSLARRRHSDEPWEVSSSGTVHRWSAGGWDWALSTWTNTLTASAVEAIKRQLADPGD